MTTLTAQMTALGVLIGILATVLVWQLTLVWQLLKETYRGTPR